MKVLSRKTRRSLIEALEGRTLLSGESAIATITDTPLSANSFQYTIALTNTGSSPIQTFWYAWTPTQGGLLAGAVTATTSPLGWSAPLTSDGIEWTTSSSLYASSPGGSALTFTFTTSEAPAQVEAAGVNTAFVYSGAAFSDAGEQISPAVITPVSTPASTEAATATIDATQLNSGDTQYTIALTDTASTPATSTNQISTFWYAWDPQGADFLPTAPTAGSITSPAGWTATVTPGTPSGFGIEWTTTSAPATAGGPALTFSFADAATHSQVVTPAVNRAFIYAGAPFSDAGVEVDPTDITPATPTPPPVSSTPSTESATATIDATQLSSNNNQYTIVLTDTATTPATTANQISTFWYAWNPAGNDFLPDAPPAGTITSPAGWTAQVTTGAIGSGIEWTTTSAPATAGGPALTFSFDDAATQSQVINSTVNVGEIYSGTAFSDAGAVVTPTNITPTPPAPPTIPTGVEKASATIIASQLTDSTYQYSLTLKNTGHGKATAANQLGTFWYAWVPNEDFLDTSPLTVNSPAGWTDTITNSGSSDGFAIQWVASANAVKVGKSLSGFSFTTTDTPGQVFGKSNFFLSTPVNTSFVYAGAPETDTGFQLTAVGSISNRAGALLPELPVATLVSGTTVPANGEVNPYGVAFVPKGFAPGGLTATGDVLVSNFNNSSNLQGTGTTIVSVTPAGATSLFYQGPAGEGLTTALGVLRSGFVLVGNVPSTDGTSATVGQGSLLVLDKLGNQVADFEDASLLDGPWDLTVVDGGGTAHVFVSNVLSGTVTRLDLKISAKADTVTIAKQTQIASGYTHGPDPAAFELGPTGLVFTKNTLYVASTDDDAIYAIKGAATLKTDVGTGTLIYQDTTHLHGPLALAVAPNGDLIAAEGDAVNADPNNPSELTEFTPSGVFIAQMSVDSSGVGGAFGLAVSGPIGANTEFAAVDDLTNTLGIWTIKTSLVKKH